MDFNRGLDVPYVQTPPAAVKEMLEMAQVTSRDFVIDLGCGDGRILIAAAKERGARGIGYDLDPRRIEESRRNASKAGVASLVEFVEGDLFTAPIGRATVVTMYLIPNAVARIRPRLESELVPGARVVSHSFPVRGWRVDRTVQVEGRSLYLYAVPVREPVRRR